MISETVWFSRSFDIRSDPTWRTLVRLAAAACRFQPEPGEDDGTVGHAQ